MPSLMTVETRALYEKHLLGKVLECPYCTTLIVFGPDLETYLYCHTCRTSYSISAEAIQYRLGAGLYPLPVPEDRSRPPEIFHQGRPHQETVYFYPLDLFLQYVHEWERFREELERGRAELQQMLAAMVSAPPSDWQAFNDALGLFTVRIPPGWSREGRWGEDPRFRLHESSARHEGFHFYVDYPQGPVRPVQEGSGSRVVDLFIGAEPITTEEYQEYASHPTFKGATFHGNPAKVGTFHGYQITVATPAAFFRISSTPDMPRLEGDLKRLVDRILDSFQLVDPKPIR
jgi:hypothetical protein